MIPVTCPHCAGRFRLPGGAVGRGGARVRCPRCDQVFDWIPARGTAGAGGDRVAYRRETGQVPSFDTGSSSGAHAHPEARSHETPAASGPGFPAGDPASPGGLGPGPGPRPDDPESPPEPASAVEELARSEAEPPLVARLAVEELANTGGLLLEAYDDGALFTRFGPALL